jgi:hypothetical protein
VSRAQRRWLSELGLGLGARVVEAGRQATADAAFALGASVEGVLEAARERGLIDAPSPARRTMISNRLMMFLLGARAGRCDLLAEYFSGRVYSVIDCEPVDDDAGEDEGPCLH